MQNSRFDALTRTLAARHSRRASITAAGLVGAALAVSRHRPIGAQEATPAGSPAATLVTSSPGFGQDFLFVQTFGSGTWAPVAGEDGRYILTLSGSAGQTVYFSDRPARVVGTVPMQQFLDGLGFTPINPPNAALVAQTETGEDVLVIELMNPEYDSETGTLTYEARVLENYLEDGLTFVADRQDDLTMASEFESASIFIDACSALGYCYIPGDPPTNAGSIPNNPIPLCYAADAPTCVPCNGDSLESYNEICNYLYLDCNGNCFAG